MIYNYSPYNDYFNKYRMYNKNNYNNVYSEKDSLKNNHINSSNLYNYNFNKSSNNKETNNVICEKNTQKNINVHSKNDDDFLITIFGIKLAFDDLLILGLLYILYMENVEDISLYIVLILLLLN